MVWLGPNVGVCFVRFRIDPSVAGTTAVTSSSINSLFLKEGNTQGAVSMTEDEATMSMAPDDGDSAIASGFIVSVKGNAGYKHSTCTLQNASTGLYNDDCADAVLPTYPVGSAMFLNGGDL